jgi:hypothetical protein
MEGMNLELVIFIQLHELFSLASEYFSKASKIVKVYRDKHSATNGSKKERKEKTKRKKSGYQLYLDYCRQEIKNNPDTTSTIQSDLTVPEISTIVSKRWRDLSPESQVGWNSKAKALMSDPSAAFPDVQVSLQQLIEEDFQIKRERSQDSPSETESDSMPVKKLQTGN